MAREQGGDGIGGTQRRAGVAFSHALDGVDGQEADRVRHQAWIDGGHSHAVPRVVEDGTRGAPEIVYHGATVFRGVPDQKASMLPMS